MYLLRDETCSSSADQRWLDAEAARFHKEHESILESIWPWAVTDFLDGQESSSLSASTLSRYGAMVEVRQGVGGEEAALWTHRLVEMYSRYAAQKMWSAEIIDMQAFESAQGNACRSATLRVTACERRMEEERVYARLKFESGVHRVKVWTLWSQCNVWTIMVLVEGCCSLAGFVTEECYRYALNLRINNFGYEC